MIPRKYRLNKEDIQKVIKSGHFLHGQGVYVKYLKLENDPKTSMFSIIVPSKIEKTSVGRHLVKRKISSIVEKLLKTLKSDYLSLIFVKKAGLKHKELEGEMTDLFRKIGLIKD